MITVNKLPLMKRSRLKAVMNYNPSNKKYGSLVILNTLNTNDLLNKFKPIDISYQNLLIYTYAKRREQIKVGNKNIIKNVLSEREEHYKVINKELPFISGINEGRLNQGFNILFDLVKANNMFIQNTGNVSKVKKPAMYWDFINRYLSDLPLNKYPIKSMYINADEFSKSIVEDLSGRSENLNPLAYLYLLMRKEEHEFFKLGNIDIIITSATGGILRVNPEECKKLKNLNKKANLAMMFRTELFKVMNRRDPETIESLEDKVFNEKNNAIQNMTKTLIDRYSYGATGEVPEEVKEKIEKAVEKAVEKVQDEEKDVNETNVEKVVDADEELLKEIVKSTTAKTMTKVSSSSKRDELLKEKQLELSIKGKSLNDILSVKSEEIEIPVNDVNSKVETINKNMTDVRFPNINKTYVEELMEKDIASMIMGLNNKSIKVFVRSINVEDTSDLLNYKETWSVELEDELRVRHKLVFDVPKVIDGKFLYLGGNRKYINNQQLLLPIVKVEPDTVQLVTNYNKIFIRRYGDKVSSLNEKLKKALCEDIKGVRVKKGKFDVINNAYVTTIDYDDLSKLFGEIVVEGTRIVFDQKEIRTQMLGLGIKNFESRLDKELLPLGNKGTTYYCIDLTTDEVVTINKEGKTISTGLNLSEFIVSLSNNLKDVVGEQKAGKKYMYSRATIMTKQVPVALILSYYEGIDGFMKRANIKHYFSDTRPRVGSDEGIIEFADGYLVYTQKPTATALLMNGFLDVPTKNYNYGDFNDKFMYQGLFEELYGRRNIANAFENFVDNFIDPMTLDVLQRLSLPTDLTGMMLYGNELLADNQFTHECLVSRIRCAEVISAIVYKNIAKSYEKYKETSTYSNPVKISMRKDQVIKDVLAQQIIEDYSELNPVSEQQKMRGCLRKGPSGCNLAQAYTEEQRSFHPGMAGIFTISSSPDGNVGMLNAAYRSNSI